MNVDNIRTTFHSIIAMKMENFHNEVILITFKEKEYF